MLQYDHVFIKMEKLSIVKISFGFTIQLTIYGIFFLINTNELKIRIIKYCYEFVFHRSLYKLKTRLNETIKNHHRNWK